MNDSQSAASIPAASIPLPSGRLPFTAVLLLALAAGFLGGAGEVLLALGRRFGGDLWLFGPDLVWVTPLAEAVVFLAVGVAYAALGTIVRPLGRPRVAVTVLAALGALAVLGEIDALHWAASALLAVGVGSAVGRAASRRGEQVTLISRRVIATGVGCALVVAVGLGVARWGRGRVAGGTVAAQGRPNILLLVLDTVRAWNLGWYGYARPTTPRLDRRLERGIVFDRALATAPWTLPSHASLFTGRWPADLSAGWDRPLDRADPTLAEVLAAAGYATGGFVGNYRFAGSSTGLDRGFGRYRDYPLDWAEALRMTSLARRLFRIPAVQVWLGRHRIIEAKSAKEVNQEFLRWVDDVQGRPYFGFLNYVDAHSPYLPPAPFDSVWTKAAGGSAARSAVGDIERVFGRGPIPADLLVEYLDGYDGAISYLDVQIDSLLSELERRGRLDNTVVIITSDHGEFFGEHGLVQHGNGLYLPVLHVPLAIWGPGLVPEGLRIGAPTSLVHLAATIADLAGAPGKVPGRSLAVHWGVDSLDREPDTLVSSVDWHRSLSKFPPSPLLDGSLRALLLDSLHYIRRSDGIEELFDLGQDFLEARNLVGSPRYRAELLRARRELESATGGRAGPRARR